jgi:putative protease
MSLLVNQTELLSPAKNVDIGREAILHGADAVYIGGPSFGARHNARMSQ